jgi:chitinase
MHRKSAAHRPTVGKGPLGKKGMNWAFMELNEAYSTSFNALITSKEASPRRFRAIMTPSINWKRGPNKTYCAFANSQS